MEGSFKIVSYEKAGQLWKVSMALPISQNSPVYSAPPTEEMLSKLIYVKWCVLVTYLCAIGLFVADADEPFGPLNDLFVACFGTFLLKEDPALAPCFRCLQELAIMGL
eukprot:s4688_g4.t1